MKTILFSILVFTTIGCTKIDGKDIISLSPTAPPVLIKNVAIFNGRDSLLVEHQDVLLENGIIEQIASNIPSLAEQQIRTIQGEGKTLMPAFIDSHVHLSGSGSVPWAQFSANEEYNLLAYLYAGVTTVYDLGGIAGDISGLSKKVNNNEIPGPSIYNTHIPITVKNSHPIPLTEQVLPWPLKKMVNTISPKIDKVENAPKIIQKYLKNDIDYVKISCDQIPPGSPEMSLKQMKALIEEAHKANKKVFVHIGSPQNAMTAVKAGADILAHGIWRGELNSEQADSIATAKIPIIYTISGFENVRSIHCGTYEPNAIDKHLVSEKILSPVTGEKGKDVHRQKVMHEFFEDVSNQAPFWRANFKLLHERGVPILVGTDSNLPGTYAGSTYFQELDLLKEYGMTNYEILRGATYANAHLFLDKPNFGFVKEGNKADLLLINGNPLENLDLVKNPALIFARGKVVEKI